MLQQFSSPPIHIKYYTPVEMGRAKLTMELIKKERSRISTFQGRKNSLKKKVAELSTLCGVKAIMIVYGPKPTPMQDHPPQPDIFPEDNVEVLELIEKYKVQPTHERLKRTSFVSNFFEDRNKKAQSALTRLRKSNVQAKYPLWDHRFDNLSEEKLFRIASFLENKLGYAEKVKILKENKSKYDTYHLQQQKMLPEKRSMDFEGSNQAHRFVITTDSRKPNYNSYNYHYPTPMQMQMPVPMPLQMQIPMPMPPQQYRPSLDQCPIQRTIKSNNPNVGGSSNFMYAAPLVKAELNKDYNDPMTGMAQSISNLNNLITVPHMHSFGDSMQSLAHNYTDESMQPMPQNYVDYPVRSSAASSRML